MRGSHLTIVAAETADRVNALAALLERSRFEVEVVLADDPKTALNYLLIGNTAAGPGAIEFLRSGHSELLRDVYVITTRVVGIGAELQPDEKIYLPFDLMRAAAGLCHPG